MSHLEAPRSSSRRAASLNPAESDTDASKLSDATLTANESSSAEEPGTVIPLQSQRPQIEDDDEEKCWICFESRKDEENEPATHGDWKRPCVCALTAHEGCLLDWISDMEKSSSNKKLQCPQCKSSIQLKQESSVIVNLGRSIEKSVRRTNSVAIVAGLGSAFFVTSAVYGVNAIYLICGTKEANALILGPGGRDFHWTWRLACGLPMVPLVLIVSRTRLLDATLPILPLIFFCHNEPFHLTLPPSPAITLALLPYLRSIYEGFYNKFMLPLDKKWTAEIGPTAATPGGDDGEVGVEIQVEGIEEEVEEIEEAEEAAPNDNADVAFPGDAQMEGNIVQEHNGGEWRVERELVLGPETANLVVGALLFPGVVASMGGILGRIPLIRKVLPERFHRNILGGCLFILIKVRRSLTSPSWSFSLRRNRETR
ncbi:hypothetical protein ABW21_db0206417 [Orbilia brochopaga]|nr:hypothetical protein ABW21_db0206417 [Drechslerella brochopaga]